MFRFGQAAAAIGVPEQRLRNWLHRNKEVDLFGARPVGGWRTFTEDDVFVLSVAARLIAYGCPVKDAFNEARTALGDVNFRTWQGLPDAICAAEAPEGWRAETDDGRLWAVCGRQLTDHIRINVPVLFAEVRRRLASAPAEAESE